MVYVVPVPVLSVASILASLQAQITISVSPNKHTSSLQGHGRRGAEAAQAPSTDAAAAHCVSPYAPVPPRPFSGPSAAPAACQCPPCPAPSPSAAPKQLPAPLSPQPVGALPQAEVGAEAGEGGGKVAVGTVARARLLHAKQAAKEAELEVAKQAVLQVSFVINICADLQ